MADNESVGKIHLDLGINQSGFFRELNNIGNSVKAQVGKIAAAAAAAFSVKKVFDFGKQAVEMASDLDEVQNVVDTAFGNMSYKMEEFAKTTIKQFGISELSAKRTGSTFMAMAKGMDMSSENASNMALQLTALSADIASFYNITQELAETKLKSVFTGETETLKDLGIVMTQTNLKAFALSKGITKNIDDMSQAEQVQLRYAYIMKQTALAQGDFSKTSKGWANQVRILNEQWKEFLTTVGTGIKSVLTPLVQWLNIVVGKMITAANAVKTLVNTMRGITDTGEENAKSAQSASDSVADVGDSAQAAAKKIKKSLMGFDELNILTKSTAENSGDLSGALGDIGMPDLNKTEKSFDAFAEKFKSMLSNMMQNMEPTTNALKRLWSDGLSRLGKFSSDNLNLFYKNFLVPVGKWTMGKGLPQFFDSVNDGIRQMDLDRLNKSFSTFYSEVSRLTIGVFEGLFQFVDKFLKPIAVWTVNKALPSFLDALSVAISKINFERINSMLGIFFSKLSAFTIEIGNGLLYILNNVLVPLAGWTISNVLPVFLDLLSAALSVLTEACRALAPAAQTIFEVFLTPIAEWTGEIILDVLGMLTELLYGISDWIKNHQQTFIVMTEIVTAFFIAWKANELLKKTDIIKKAIISVIDVVKNFDVIIGLMKESLAAVLTPTNLLIAGFALLGVGIVELMRNWDKMSPLARWGTIFGGLVAAIAAASIAMAVFQTTLTAGIAAGAIAAGIALIIGTQASIRKATDVNSYMSVPAMAKGGIVTQPTLAMVGERGREAVMPLENNTGWIDELALKLSALMPKNSGSSASSQPVILQINETELGRVIVQTSQKYNRQVGVAVL